ncbi:MAG: VWA domain-containing protein, partial [Streptomycetaceae bacterium]|nr:VWA domain-containing protein [Streptomycetaceae bacterium]
NMWTERFLPDHVAVLERRHPVRARAARDDLPDVRRWFAEHTYRVTRGGLEDGTDVDIDQYVAYHADRLAGEAREARVFKDLLPGARDVCTALLLDASSSLGARDGRIFRLELACADALSQAMTAAGERHGVFAFSGNTRHRVDVRCLKDFPDRGSLVPSASGLDTGGYTRLGAPLRHLTSRLSREPAERRLLLVIGDGNMSDEGYEGRYAWSDVAHAVEEAADAGVAAYYIGLGTARVDPLPDTFGARRSTRIRRVEDLPRILARVHHELVTA